MRRLRDVKYHETVSEMLARQFELAKVDEARQGALFQVIDPASPPDTRSFPKRALTVAVVFVFSFVLAYFYCLGVDGWNRWKRDPQVSIIFVSPSFICGKHSGHVLVGLTARADW